MMFMPCERNEIIMINYNKKLENQSQLTTVITKEIELINELQLSQNKFKDYINTYVEEISVTFANDEVFKNMLLASLETAQLQVGINLQDLTNLHNILDIILEQKNSLKQNIEQYNKLFEKVEKNIDIVKEIMQKTINSYEQLSNISKNASNVAPKNAEKLNEIKKVVSETNAPKQEEKKSVSRDVKDITDKTSSDLLCFFPKSDNDILAISTVQNNYKVLFKDNQATVCIEEDNFNFTVTTVGVQISNSENVLLISHENGGYYIITNMPIEVPSYINVSRIGRNKNFVEIAINNSALSISVDKNEITFSDEFEKNSTTSTETYSVSPSSTEPLPENLVANTVKEPVGIGVAVSSENKLEINPEVASVSDDTTSENNTSNTTDVKSEELENTENTTIEEHQKEEPREIGIKLPTIDDIPHNTSGIDLTKDNDTLIISEEKNQVILPYKLSEVEKQYKKSKKKYASVEELIQNEYIVSTDNFKNPVKSRFREAYQLIKKKEHGHLKEAIELGFELMFQSNLNPAIIAACKSLKELDIYLDCLDENELDKFSCFNIVYNVNPTKGKPKKK